MSLRQRWQQWHSQTACHADKSSVSCGCQGKVPLDSRENLPREGEAAIGIPNRRVDKTRITKDLSIDVFVWPSKRVSRGSSIREESLVTISRWEDSHGLMEKRSKFNSSRCSFYLSRDYQSECEDEREEKAISILNVDDSIRKSARVGRFRGGGF